MMATPTSVPDPFDGVSLGSQDPVAGRQTTHVIPSAVWEDSHG